MTVLVLATHTESGDVYEATVEAGEYLIVSHGSRVMPDPAQLSGLGRPVTLTLREACRGVPERRHVCSVGQVGDREWFCSTHQRSAEDCDFVIQEDVQCGRCGSSMSFEDCGACDDGQVECGDPIQCCDGTHACTQCLGEGGWSLCLSTREWCLANPRPGHEDVPRHTAETFTYPEPRHAD